MPKVLRAASGRNSSRTTAAFYVLSIQGYSAATLKPYNASFSFRGEEIEKLVEFINHIQSMPLNHGRAMRVADADLRRLVLSRMQVANQTQVRIVWSFSRDGFGLTREAGIEFQ
jgi:hypothetical protein